MQAWHQAQLHSEQPFTDTADIPGILYLEDFAFVSESSQSPVQDESEQ